MRRFRKKPPSANATNNPPRTPTPPIVEYIKRELATFYPRAKDRRALAASSSAIATSIASPSFDPIDTALNDSGSSKESVWKTAYGAARMAVEIANASSDMLLPLKAVVGALLVLMKNYDRTTANADQIREVEERIRSLGGVLAYPVDDEDTEEKKRRKILRRKLAGIIAKLKPLSEQHGIMKFLKNVDHANILSGFVQDLAYAVTDYQTSLQQSIHENTKKIGKTTKEIGESARNIIKAADHELLRKLNPVYNAGYKAGHHDTCLRGTRESVLDGIMRWTEDLQDRHVFWLNGLAGTGKSTIAQTFSQMVAKTGALGASFFCSRDYLDRRELKNIFPTLAYQLACRYPAFRHRIIRVINEDPSVASNSLISQLEDLIVGPLSSSKISCVIVVDALDECIDDQPASAILSVLGRHVKQLSSAKFFITGRPEPRIRTGFRLPLLEPFTQIFLLHEVKPSDVDGDIRLYLQDKLAAVSNRRSDLDLSDPWPCGEALTTLTKKSSGLFIFASTLVRFIESEHHEPNERLQLLITPSDSTIYEGQAGIDLLYTQILVQAFPGVKDPTVFKNLRRVLGAVVLAFNPLSRVQIAGILGVNTSLITRSLRHLHSVLSVPNEDSKEIRVFHKSFPDFLQDPDRCSDPRFFIDSPVRHGDIALDCLELLKKLNSNPCDLPDFVMNRDVTDLPKLLEDRVGSAMRYACSYWAMHVRSSPTANDYVIRSIPSVAEFFEKNAVPWVEVMSLENRLESVIYNIYDLLDWLRMVNVSVSDLHSLAQDYLRFTMHFFRLIQQSASHVYHSALPLSPRLSKVRSWNSHKQSNITGFHGRLEAWGIIVQTITSGSKRFTHMTTFSHRIAAVCDDGTVGIFDSVTGVMRLSLSPADPVQAIRGSPDGSILFCAHKTPSITVWDVQTGGLIHTFVLKRNPGEIAVSSKGRYFACGLSDGSCEVREVADEMEDAAIWSSSPVTRFCWMEPEERLALSTRASVTILDVVTGTVLHSFVIQYPVHRMVYCQKFDRLAIEANSGSKSVMTIINPRTGTPTLSHLIRTNMTCFAFSQATEELVCGMETHELRLFNISTRRWRNIEYPDTMTSVSSLPNGTLAANFTGSGLQLLNLDQGNAVSQRPTALVLTVHPFDEDRVIAVLSANRDRIMLLKTATMSPLLTIPVEDTHTIFYNHAVILCASIENLAAVYCFNEKGKEYMQLWNPGRGLPSWTVEIDGLPSTGGISPSGTRLITYEAAHISVWDALNGELQARLPARHANPSDITILTESEFYIHDGSHRVDYLISSSESRDRHYTPFELFTSSTPLEPVTRSYSVVRQGDPFKIERPQERYYDVDETREWVIGDSKRVCWIPPGYIGSAQPSHCWAGNSLVMAGQDGMLRKLTFR